MDEATLQRLLVDSSVLDRAEIAGVLAGQTSTGRPHDFRSAFMKAAAAVEETDPALSGFYLLLALAFDPRLRTDQPQEPFGPLIMFGNGSLRDLSPAHLDLLQAALGKVSTPAFVARLADILWTYKHGKGQALLGFAAAAVRAYLAEARSKQLGSEWPFAPTPLERALRLSYQVDRPPGDGLSKEAREATAALADAFETERQWGAAVRAFHLMQEFGVGEATANAEACERCAANAEADHVQIAAETFREQAIAFWRRAKDDARAEEAVRQAAELAVRQSEARQADSPGVAAHFLEGAIKLLRRIPAARRGEREAELLVKLSEQQARSLEHFGQVSATFDGQETWERAEAAVAGKTLLDALIAFALNSRPLNVPTLRKQIEADASEFLFMRLMPILAIGSGGKKIKEIPTMDADDPTQREAAARYHMVSRANMHQEMIGRAYVEGARRRIAAEHGVSIPDLLPIMHASGFVPHGREWQWAKAIAAGFDDDFTTATHILVPQLEHALRALLRNAGNTAVAMDRFGQQEDWNLNQILLGEGRQATEAILGDDIVFDLSALLVDRGGANLRNAVSHGLVDDGGLEGGLSRHLFWASLRLCIIPFAARAEELRRARAQAVQEADNQELDADGSV